MKTSLPLLCHKVLLIHHFTKSFTRLYVQVGHFCTVLPCDPSCAFSSLVCVGLVSLLSEVGQSLDLMKSPQAVCDLRFLTK
jgi:hypothetical protein